MFDQESEPMDARFAGSRDRRSRLGSGSAQGSALQASDRVEFRIETSRLRSA
jgi:hypothetical protein